MQINTIQNNPYFTSRNPAIRLADDIARRVNLEFPRISKEKSSFLPTVKKLKNISAGRSFLLLATTAGQL